MMEMQVSCLYFQRAVLWVGTPPPVTGRHCVDFKESSTQTEGLKKSGMSISAGDV